MKLINFVGIDMAKNDFYACFNELTEPRKFNNTTLGINSFLNYLAKCNYQTSDTVIGVESTASYHLRLCLQCSQAGYQVKVINPLLVKKQNQTELRKVKNDRHDARLIRFCLAGGAGYEFNNDSDSLYLKESNPTTRKLGSSQIEGRETANRYCSQRVLP